ncbi:AAA family ATPase, partial [Campylobacter jejuni]|nr:AAA family ATPase [Campylobacter jejuni]
MCRKIEVKNFGPIKYIDIKVKPLTILIGKSGTGKSALMKLIHCLNTLITFISFTNIEEKLDIFDKNKILEFDLLEFDLNEEGFRNIFKNFE